MSEQQLVNAAINYLNAIGFTVWRQNQGGMKIENRFIRFAHMEGISDIIGIMPNGGFFAGEAKRPGNKPTEKQAAFLASVNEHPLALGIWFNSIDNLIEQLEEQEIS